MYIGIFIIVRAGRRENFDARSQYIIYVLPTLFQTRRTHHAHIILRTHIHRDRNIIWVPTHTYTYIYHIRRYLYIYIVHVVCFVFSRRCDVGSIHIYIYIYIDK